MSISSAGLEQGGVLIELSRPQMRAEQIEIRAAERLQEPIGRAAYRNHAALVATGGSATGLSVTGRAKASPGDAREPTFSRPECQCPF